MTQSLVPRAQNDAWNTMVSIAPNLPQGMILIGPSGVGKRRAAKALFQYLNCQAGTGQEESSLFGEAPVSAAAEIPCGSCTSCKKIFEGRHADLIEIQPKGETIPVDDLREMKKTLYFAPLEGKTRFVIIDDAHKLNAASANTLLKTLEEPPAHTRFFLITHERGLLLPTIVSRCQFIHFSPLDPTTLKELLSQQGLEFPPGLQATCLDLMAGGLDRAALLASEKTLSFLEGITGVIDRAGLTHDWNAVVQLADQMSGQSGAEDWKLELLLDLMLRSSRHLAVKAASGEACLTQAARALEAATLRRRLVRNANKKLVALAAADLATQSGAIPR